MLINNIIGQEESKDLRNLFRVKSTNVYKNYSHILKIFLNSTEDSPCWICT